MKPYLLERLEGHHDEREDRPATLTEYDLDQLDARSRWGVAGAWIAVAAIVILAGLLVRSEWNAHRIEVASRASNAALVENVRQLNELLADRTAESRIAKTAVNATEESYARLTGQVAALSARQQALSRDQEALAARIEQQTAHVANLGLWRSEIDGTRGPTEARIAALETSAKSNAEALDARLSKLDRRVESIDKSVVAQATVDKSTRDRQNLMLGAIPFVLVPYVHILDHSGR